MSVKCFSTSEIAQTLLRVHQLCLFTLLSSVVVIVVLKVATGDQTLYCYGVNTFLNVTISLDLGDMVMPVYYLLMY